MSRRFVVRRQRRFVHQLQRELQLGSWLDGLDRVHRLPGRQRGSDESRRLRRLRRRDVLGCGRSLHDLPGRRLLRGGHRTDPADLHGRQLLSAGFQHAHPLPGRQLLSCRSECAHHLHGRQLLSRGRQRAHAVLGGDLQHIDWPEQRDRLRGLRRRELLPGGLERAHGMHRG